MYKKKEIKNKKKNSGMNRKYRFEKERNWKRVKIEEKWWKWSKN